MKTPNMLQSRRHRSRAHDAIIFCLQKLEFETVLDICCGDGFHSEVFKESGKKVTSVDHTRDYADHKGVYQSIDFEPHDLTWCSKALEHQLNVHDFLKKVRRETKVGGYTCITVPPLKHDITGGHVTLWNAGLLLYNLVLAGFDCSNAHIKTYRYNISVVAQAADFELPPLNYDLGDIELLKPWLPWFCEEPFDGFILDYNWD